MNFDLKTIRKEYENLQRIHNEIDTKFKLLYNKPISNNNNKEIINQEKKTKRNEIGEISKKQNILISKLSEILNKQPEIVKDELYNQMDFNKNIELIKRLQKQRKLEVKLDKKKVNYTILNEEIDKKYKTVNVLELGRLSEEKELNQETKNKYKKEYEEAQQIILSSTPKSRRLANSEKVRKIAQFIKKYNLDKKYTKSGEQNLIRLMKDSDEIRHEPLSRLDKSPLIVLPTTINQEYKFTHVKPKPSDSVLSN